MMVNITIIQQKAENFQKRQKRRDRFLRGVKHFRFKNLDINKPVLRMAYDPPEKHIICAPRQYNKNVLK